MACQGSIFLFVTVLSFVAHPNLLLVQSRLLPIVDDHDSGSAKTQVYIVHVQKPMGNNFGHFKDRSDWYMSFLPNSTLDSGKPRMIYMYRDVISGFAARLTADEVMAMENLEGFVLAHPEKEDEPLTTYTPHLLGLSTWSGLWPDSFMGQGQVIGVIDTGIKPTHHSFRDHGVPPAPTKWNGRCYWGKPICNKKLIGAASFKHGAPDSPEDNVSGHGTHCAGIAAGNFVDNAEVLGQGLGTASGMAPKAHLAVYKVLHPRKNKRLTAYYSDTLKGIDEAIRDHVDVLSMSLGTVNVSALAESPVVIGSYAAVTKGIVPVAAAGNYGPWKSLIVNDAPWVLTVGASNIDRRIAVTVKLGNGKEYHGQSAYQPEAFSSQQLPLVYPGVLKTVETLLCLNGSLDTFDVKGKIVLCGVGGIRNEEKGEIVKAAGGAALILLNQEYGGNTTSAEPHVLPAANLNHADSLDLLTKYVETEKNPTAAIIFSGTQYGARPSPTLASFSSRGPSLVNGNIIKPDLVAPGVNILSAWPFQVGPNSTTATTQTFNFLSGTSMATPHVSGIVALLKNNHPNWSPAAIKSALMTTAFVVDFDGNPIKDDHNGTAVGAYGMGAGHVDPVAANDPGLVYDIQPHDYIAYLCGSGFSDRDVTAIVRGWTQCSRVRSFPADQLNYPSIAVYLGSNSTSRTIKRTATNVGDADSSYDVKFDEPEGVSMDINPPTLKFSKIDEKQSYEVTFSIKDGFSPVADQYSEGHIAWSSGKYYVRSPIVVTFH